MSVTSPPAPLAEHHHPDAELIRLCGHHAVNLHAYNNGPSKPVPDGCQLPRPVWRGGFTLML